MKTLVIVALATALASPVLAQSYDPDLGSGNIAPPIGAAPVKVQNARDAFALHVGVPGVSRDSDVLFERAKGGIE